MGAIKENPLDRFISYLNPAWGMDRMRSKVKLEIVRERLRNYDGAGHGPLIRDWNYNHMSAQAEIYRGQPTLRERMRDLIRNDAWAQRAVHALTNNIIGTGIRPTINASNAGPKKKIEADFLAWCGSTKSDYYGRNTFYGNQRLALMAMAGDGDALIVRRYSGSGRNMILTPQILEADYLVSWRTFVNTDGSYVLKGIHYDTNGRVLGYDIYVEHPGNLLKVTGLKYNYHDAKNVIHLFRTDRPGQGSGIPWGTGAMLDHKMLNDYLKAQAHKQRLSASITGAITTADAEHFGTDNTTTGVERANKPDYPNIAEEGFVPGLWQYLYPGEEIHFLATPKVDELDIYVRVYLKKIASAWNLTYEVMSGDMSDTNFASGRMGWLEMHRFVSSMQEHLLIPGLCTRVWEWWLDLEILKGNVSGNSYGLQCDWTPPRREIIDPLKDAKAMEIFAKMGIQTTPDMIRSMGNDPVKQLAEIAAWNKAMDAAGVVLSSDYRVIHEENMKGKEEDGADSEGENDPEVKKKPKASK